MKPTTPSGRPPVWRLAGYDLPGSGALPAEPLDGRAWEGLVELVRAQQVEGILADAIAAGRWPATGEQAEKARSLHREAMASVLFVDRRLSDLAPALDRSGVRWRVLGGVATAHLDEPNPSRRTYRQLDLLVDEDGFAAALHLLAGLGGERIGPVRSEAFDRMVLEEAAMALPDGVEVHLHRTLASGPYGLALDPTRLFALPTDELVVGGARVEALGGAGRFVHSCYRAVLGQQVRSIPTLREVALTFPRGEPTARAAHALARSGGGEAVLAAALNAASDSLGWEAGGELAVWARSLRPHERDRRWLAAYDGPSSSPQRRVLLGVEALPDLRSRVTYAAYAVFDLAREAITSDPTGSSAGPRHHVTP